MTITSTATLAVRKMILLNIENVSKETAKKLKTSFLEGSVLIFHNKSEAQIYHDCIIFKMELQQKVRKGETFLTQEINVLCLDIDEDSSDLEKHSQKIKNCIKIGKCNCSLERNFKEFWKDLIK